MKQDIKAIASCYRLFIYIIFTVLFLTSCASMPEKLQKKIAGGDFTEAVDMGEEFLVKKSTAPDARQVWDLVWEADYKIAIAKDTVAAYESFENKYVRKAYPPVVAVKAPEKVEKKPAKKKKKTKKDTITESEEGQSENARSYNSTPVYKDLPYDFMERKSNSYYRDVTVPAGTASAAKEFQSLYADSPLKPKARELELLLAWKEAEKEVTVDGWKRFRASYPEHPRLKEALTIETDLAWKTAQQKGTEEALSAFQLEYPDSPYALSAQDKVCQLAWNDAQAKNSVEAYRVFRNKHARCGTSVVQAREKEEQLAWNRALVDASVSSLDAFIKDYPDSSHIKEALDKVCDLGWTAAQAKKTGAALRDFREKYPHCTTQIALAGDKEDQFAWDDAVKSNTWEGYRDFIDTYPHSPHAVDAEARRRDLWGFAGPTGADELDTYITSIDDRDPTSIKLFVQVMDKDNTPVGGLRRSNFSIFENACPTEITGFEGMEADRPVDIVFVMDTTGSMAKEIDGVKRAAIQFAENLRMRNRAANLALVTFGDEIRFVSPFTSDIRTFQGWVAKQKAEAGGDDPENDLGALEKALSLKFRPEAQVVFVLVTDAPMHEANAITPLTVKRMSEMLKSQRVSLFTIGPDIEQFRTFTKLAGGPLYDLEKQTDFSRLIEAISTMTAKQYLVAYKGTDCRLESPGRQARVRARQDNLWLPLAQIASKDVADLAVDETDPKLRYLATRDAGLLRSTDGGATWAVMGDDLMGKAFEEILPLGAKLMAKSKDGKVYFSTDKGGTWSLVKKLAGGVLSLIKNPGDVSKPFAATATSIFGSSDGGSTWGELTKTGLEFISSLTFDSADGRLIAFGKGTEARVSRDGGTSWKELKMVLPEPGASLADYRLYPHPKRKGLSYLVKPGGDIFRSLNGGSSWEKVTPIMPGISGITATGRLQFDPSKRGWVVAPTSHGVFGSSDSGRSWFPLGEGVEGGDRRKSAVAFGPDGSTHLAGGTSGSLYELNPVGDREFISGNVYFDTGSAAINDSLKGYLNELAGYLHKHPGKQARIEGHTDDVGADDLNMRLSLQRAQSVREHLASLGINSARIITTGSGKYRPLVPNDSAENRAKNRRVELMVLGK